MEEASCARGDAELIGSIGQQGQVALLNAESVDLVGELGGLAGGQTYQRGRVS